MIGSRTVVGGVSFDLPRDRRSFSARRRRDERGENNAIGIPSSGRARNVSTIFQSRVVLPLARVHAPSNDRASAIRRRCVMSDHDVASSVSLIRLFHGPPCRERQKEERTHGILKLFPDGSSRGLLLRSLRTFPQLMLCVQARLSVGECIQNTLSVEATPCTADAQSAGQPSMKGKGSFSCYTRVYLVC